jgi:hypothetical protein
MKRIYIFIPMLLTLSGCFSGGPSANEIKEAYSKAHNKVLKFMRMDGPYVSSIDWHECKESSNELAWPCSFKVAFDNGEEIDKLGKFTKTSNGWDYKPN